jgi:AraC-like DNA-binding protein
MTFSHDSHDENVVPIVAAAASIRRNGRSSHSHSLEELLVELWVRPLPAGAGRRTEAYPTNASGQPVARDNSDPSTYAAIVRHIRENLSRRITVDELAAIARVSVFQLSRELRREHATTPYQLVLDLRIQHAKDRLDAGATISETALQAGFADQSHFTRHFKRATGITPKRYSRIAERMAPGAPRAFVVGALRGEAAD